MWFPAGTIALGFIVVCTGFFLPWFSLDPDKIGVLQDILTWLGALPDLSKPVRGYEIPTLLGRELEHPIVQGAQAISELTAGQVDRFGARVFLGERSESGYGGLVLIPLFVTWCSLGLLRFRTARVAAAGSMLLSLATGLAMVWWWHRVTGDNASPPLRVYSGYLATLGGLLVTAFGAYLISRGPKATQRRKRKN
jgi:hypothetical protein